LARTCPKWTLPLLRVRGTSRYIGTVRCGRVNAYWADRSILTAPAFRRGFFMPQSPWAGGSTLNHGCSEVSERNCQLGWREWSCRNPRPCHQSHGCGGRTASRNQSVHACGNDRGLRPLAADCHELGDGAPPIVGNKILKWQRGKGFRENPFQLSHLRASTNLGLDQLGLALVDWR
jgi:hypothetical protein